MIVLALRIGLRWDDILRMPVRSVLTLIQAEHDWRQDRSDAAVETMRKAKAMPVFDLGGLL